MTSPRRRRTPAVGRPTKLTPAVAENVRKAVRAGAALKHAAQAQRVGYSTVMRWMSDGEKHEPKCAGLDEYDDRKRTTVNVCKDPLHIYREFREAVKQAEAELIVELNARLNDAARAKNPNAILAMLRHADPETYTPTERRDVRVSLREHHRGEWAKVPRKVAALEGGREEQG